MEIKIEVSEEKFKDVLEKELKSYSEEELHDICKNCLVSLLSDVEKINELLNKKDSYYSNDTKLEKLLYEAVKKIDFTQTYKDIQDAMINYIKDNQKELLTKLILEVFINGLSQNIYNSPTFKDNLNKELYNLNCNIHQDIDQRLNNR